MPDYPITANDRYFSATAIAAQTVFTPDFPLLTAEELRVDRTRAGAKTTLLLTTNYTITGLNQEAGFTCTLTAGALVGDILEFFGATDMERQSDYPASQALRSAALNGDLDRALMRDQELRRDLTYLNENIIIGDDVLTARDEAEAAAAAAAVSQAATAASAVNAANSETASAASALTSGAHATNAAASAAAAANSVDALAFIFRTATADADPGAGNLRLNNGTQSSATAAFIDNADANAVDVSALLDLADDSTSPVKSKVTIRAKADATIRRTYNLSGAVVDGTGYRKFTLAHVDGNGAFTDGMPIWLIVDRIGDKGADGLGAGDVLGPVGAVVGRIATFSNTDGKHIQDSGTALTSLAPLASPPLTGNPTAPTQSQADDSTKIATTAYVRAAIAAVLNGVSSAFDTLAEIATAIAGKATLAQVDFISGIIEAPTNKDYKVAVKLPYGITITDVTTISTAGTCTLTPKINTTPLGGTANSVSTSEQSQAHASANVASAGDDVVLTVSANSACVNLAFRIQFTRNLAAS